MSLPILRLRPAARFCCDVPGVAGHAPPAAQWALVSAAVLVTLYFVMRSGRKKKADPLARSPTQAGLSQQRNVERQMSNLLVELSEMSRQITAQLDTRATKLALMIDDADEKAALLQRMLDDCRAALAAVPLPPATPASPPTAPPPPRPAEPAAEDAVFAPSLALADASDARHQQVYALADQGRSASDIARQIDRPHGEVELILALRPR